MLLIELYIFIMYNFFTYALPLNILFLIFTPIIFYLGTTIINGGIEFTANEIDKIRNPARKYEDIFRYENEKRTGKIG